MSRSTIEFNAGAEKQLNNLTAALDLKSKAEVVRNALTLYDYVVNYLQAHPDHVLGFINENADNRIDKVILVPGVVNRQQPVLATR